MILREADEEFCENGLLITGNVTMQSIRTAEMLDFGGIFFSLFPTSKMNCKLKHSCIYLCFLLVKKFKYYFWVNHTSLLWNFVLCLHWMFTSFWKTLSKYCMCVFLCDHAISFQKARIKSRNREKKEKHFHKKSALVSSRFEKSSGRTRCGHGNTKF